MNEMQESIEIAKVKALRRIVDELSEIREILSAIEEKFTPDNETDNDDSDWDDVDDDAIEAVVEKEFSEKDLPIDKAP